MEISAEGMGGDSVRVWFKDNGIGIAPENHKRIFRLFERIHPIAEYEGTGIGLTIVRKAAHRMGAEVGFKSELGAGSNFWIQLKKHKVMRTILQVEDDPNDVFLFQHAMTKAGVTNPIQVASDGQQAIDYLQGAGKFADRDKYPFPCLVLLDLKLPYVMGLEVLKWIRKQRGTDLTVLMLTASGEEADVKSAYRLGANGFLTKPSEARKLNDIVNAIKDFWLTHNMLPSESPPRFSAGRNARLVHSSTSELPAGRRPVNGTRREEWPLEIGSDL